MLRLAFEQAGFNNVTAHIVDIKKGKTDFLTTTNKALLEKAAGPEIDVFELSEKNYDLTQLVDSAKRILGVEATSSDFPKPTN